MLRANRCDIVFICGEIDKFHENSVVISEFARLLPFDVKNTV